MKTIFISTDTLRSDHLGCLGHPGHLTPNLDRIAGEGALFAQAYSTDIPTQPSHTALFTGRFGVNTSIVSHFHPDAHLGEDVPWLPSIFSDLGCATGAVDHLFAMKDWFVRGYEDYMPPPGRSRSPASVINEIAFPWLAKHAEDDFFLFLHYWDAHIPYVPPEPFKQRYTAHSASQRDPLINQKLRSRPTYPLFKQNLYDHLTEIPNLDYVADLYNAEVAYLDFEIGNLFDHLRRLGILDDAVIVLFGDHGENMTEHDAWFDHAGLYDSVVHVPLIIRAPGRVAPTTVTPMVALVDVMPTVLGLQELTLPSGLDGRSLQPLMAGQTDVHRNVVMLSEATWAARRGVRTKDWKYIRCYDPGVYPRAGDELYNLVADPSEQVNVVDQHPEVAAQMSGLLDRWLVEQLGGRPDPMDDVITAGLPAVTRLDGLIGGAAAATVVAAGLLATDASLGSDASLGTPGLAGVNETLPESGAVVPTVGVALAESRAGVPALVGGLPAVVDEPTAPVPVADAGPPVYRPADRHQRGRHGGRRAVFALAISLLALAALAFVVNAVFLNHSVQASGIVEPVSTAQLNLGQVGPITAVDVSAGQVVKAGEVLARGDSATAEAKLAADEAKLASDQAALGDTSTPPAATTSPAANAQSDQIQSDQTQLATAQAKLADVTATENSDVASAAAQVQSDQNLLAEDEQTENASVAACVSADPPPSCAADKHQVQSDQASLADAQTAYQAALAQQSSAVADAQNGVTVAQDALAEAEGQPVASTTATTLPVSAQIAAAQAAVAADNAAIAADQQALAATVLEAPFAGVVASVNGAVGDLQTQAGVAQSQAPSGVTSTGSSGINIFPTAPAPSTKPNTQFAPLIELDSVTDRVVVQVPENDISKVHVGQRAHVTLPAVPGSSFEATVTQIQPTAVTVGTEYYYLVDLSVPDPRTTDPSVLPFSATSAGRGGHRTGLVSSDGKLVGLTADVTF